MLLHLNELISLTSDFSTEKTIASVLIKMDHDMMDLASQTTLTSTVSTVF